MIIALEYYVLAAMFAAGLSVYIPFLPVKSLPLRIFISLTMVTAILWMACAWGMGFGKNSVVIILAAGLTMMGLLHFRRENFVKAKVMLSFASGMGLLMILYPFLLAYGTYVKVANLPWFITKCYVASSALAATGILLFFTIFKKAGYDIPEKLISWMAYLAGLSSLILIAGELKGKPVLALVFLGIILFALPFNFLGATLKKYPATERVLPFLGAIPFIIASVGAYLLLK